MDEYNGWTPRTDSQENLTALADVMADGIRYHWGQRDINMGILELAAAELNRRHGHASIQNYDDMLNAPEILEDVDQVHGCYDGDMDINWGVLFTSEARALGVLLDMGDGQTWIAVGLRRGDWSREDARERLFELALSEGRARGFDHAPRRAVLIPFDADDLTAPF